MAKKKNNKPTEKPIAEDYYKLKVEAVEKLVNAKDAPEVSDEEIRKYTRRGRFQIPDWLKVVFVKFWFAGAICYFFLWGLGNYINRLDLMVILAVGLGVATDLLVNHILRGMEPTDRAYDKWMFITVRKFWSLFLNMIYAGVLLFCVYQTYFGINTMLVGDVNTAESVPVAVEPILFGLFYMGFDLFFIMIKNGIKKIFRDAEKKAAGGGK